MAKGRSRSAPKSRWPKRSSSPSRRAMTDLAIAYGAATDTGFLREQNEDRYWIDEALGAYLVVDGVGGHAAGERAAEIAVDAIREVIASPGDAEGRVRAAIAAANQ